MPEKHDPTQEPPVEVKATVPTIIDLADTKDITPEAPETSSSTSVKCSDQNKGKQIEPVSNPDGLPLLNASNLAATSFDELPAPAASISLESSRQLKPVPPLEEPVETKDPPKPAQWTVHEPNQPWCPAELEKSLGFKIEYKNELTEHSETMADWMVTAATKRGRMHAHHGSHREDAFHYRKEKHFSLYCVCDGAGSSELSRVGSEYTSRSLCDLVGDELLANEAAILKCSSESLSANLKNVLHHGVVSVAIKLTELAKQVNRASKDFRCTVLTVLQYQHPSGGIFVFGNVGDGFLAVKRKGQQAERLGTSDSGSFSGEVTCFMPDSQVGDFYKASLEKIVPVFERDVEAIVLCTDGIEDPFFPIHRTIPKLCQQLEDGFREPINDVKYPKDGEPKSVFRSDKPDHELLKWLGFEKRGENDDRTIMLIYRKSAPRVGITTKSKSEEESSLMQKVNTENQVDRDSSNISINALLVLVMIGIVFLVLLSFWMGYKWGKSQPSVQFSTKNDEGPLEPYNSIFRITAFSRFGAYSF